MKFFLTLCLVASIGCASATTGKVLNVGVVMSASADLASTRLAIESGRGREANAVMGQSLWQQATVKGLGVGSILGLSWVLEQKHPVLTNLLRASVIGFNAAISAHNMQIARGR